MKKLGQYNSAPVSAPVGGTFYPTIFFLRDGVRTPFFPLCPARERKICPVSPRSANFSAPQRKTFCPAKFLRDGVRTRLVPLAPLAPQKNASIIKKKACAKFLRDGVRTPFIVAQDSAQEIFALKTKQKKERSAKKKYVYVYETLKCVGQVGHTLYIYHLLRYLRHFLCPTLLGRKCLLAGQAGQTCGATKFCHEKSYSALPKLFRTDIIHEKFIDSG